ncbi:hypothetical protein [Qipengyuania flava]|uniref:hypothetical protein n=1 Tax=Qipengyuania flava TaxID=192812 RepID=UPI001CFE1427|nr:hypothetical protein [Qipengyuania flava]
MTAYELAGDQILICDDDDGSSSIVRSLILTPDVTPASDDMVKATAKLGISALGMRCLLQPDGERVSDLTVLFAEDGAAERFASMRP